MTRKFPQLFAAAALFGGLATSTAVLAGPPESWSQTPNCEKMTIGCWQKDEEMERLSDNNGMCIRQMKARMGA